MSGRPCHCGHAEESHAYRFHGEDPLTRPCGNCYCANYRDYLASVLPEICPPNDSIPDIPEERRRLLMDLYVALVATGVSFSQASAKAMDAAKFWYEGGKAS